MKKYWIQYKPFLLFLGKFSFTYLVLLLVYQAYLSQYNEQRFEVDYFTKSVAEQTKHVLLLFDGAVMTKLMQTQPSVMIQYHGKNIARIVEGCNALSVIVLFVAFVVAFTGKWKPTLFFILGGSLLIHGMNVLRIAALVVLIYHFPEQEPLLHGVVFPLIIYSSVFILWVIWVNKFSLYATKATSK